jgi:RadC-like JAB domain
MVVFTGKLACLTRREAQAKVRELGGETDVDRLGGVHAGLRKVVIGDEDELALVVLVALDDLAPRHLGAVDAAHAAILDRRQIRAVKAVNLIVAHNHPSGDPTPSPDDIAMANKLREGGRLLDIQVLDSLVIGATSHVSMKAEDLMT